MKNKATFITLLILGVGVVLAGCGTSEPPVDPTAVKTPEEAKNAGLGTPESAQGAGTGGQPGEMNTGA